MFMIFCFTCLVLALELVSGMNSFEQYSAYRAYPVAIIVNDNPRTDTDDGNEKTIAKIFNPRGYYDTVSSVLQRQYEGYHFLGKRSIDNAASKLSNNQLRKKRSLRRGYNYFDLTNSASVPAFGGTVSASAHFTNIETTTAAGRKRRSIDMGEYITNNHITEQNQETPASIKPIYKTHKFNNIYYFKDFDKNGKTTKAMPITEKSSQEQPKSIDMGEYITHNHITGQTQETPVSTTPHKFNKIYYFKDFDKNGKTTIALPISEKLRQEIPKPVLIRAPIRKIVCTPPKRLAKGRCRDVW